VIVFKGSGGIRSGWRYAGFMLLTIVLVFLLQGFGGEALATILHLKPDTLDAQHELLGEIFIFIGVFIATAIAARLERRSILSYGLPASEAFRGKFWEGIAIGVVTAGLVAVAMYAMGGFVISGFALHGTDWIVTPLLWAAAMLLVGLAEESWFRGYPLHALARGIGSWPAAIISSLIFGALHLIKADENFIDIFNIIAHRHAQRRGASGRNAPGSNLSRAAVGQRRSTGYRSQLFHASSDALDARVYSLSLSRKGERSNVRIPNIAALALVAVFALTGAANDAVRGDRAEGWLQQSRSPVIARNGMVATSQPLAAQAGLRILMQGGNAVDAAVATAAALNVTEPMNVGIGGDLFAIIYVAKEHAVHVLDASGIAPSGATLAHMRDLGYAYDPAHWGPGSGMPSGGILDVTVPGAAWGWDEMVRRYGTMKFARVLAPAIDYAQNGYPVSERIAHDWVLPAALPLRGCCTKLDPDSVSTWYIDGKAPQEGEIFRNPELARALTLLGKNGRDGFYKGKIARAIIAKSRALGGTMTLSDLAAYHGVWRQPARTMYHGYDVLELPPPSQGFATNEALNILQQCVPAVGGGQTLAALGPANALYWHLLVEAKKLAYADAYRYDADPDVEQVPLSRLLSNSYAASLCSKIDAAHASDTGSPGQPSGAGDTIVLSTADRWGNMVSLVNSNYSGFGSGITVPRYGFILHNRGGLFTLDPKSPNAIAPGKRPFNTLCAGFVFHNGKPYTTIGLMGGDMQAQGHEQVVVDLLDLGANIQQAGDMARFRHDQVSNTLMLESPLDDLLGAKLSAMGHHIKATNRAPMGGYQAIMVLPNGAYAGGSDFGKDGEVVGW